jgi:hypothetical protein
LLSAVVVIIALQITISVLEEDSFEEIEVAEFLRENCSCDDEARDIVTTYTSVDTIRDVFRNKSTEHCPYGNFLSNETESMELSFGADKQIYIFFFIGFVIYNILSLAHALWAKSIVNVYYFLLLNFLLVLYSFLQVYQFRSFDESQGGLERIGFIALANAIVMLLFTLLFVLFTIEMHTQFGWWIFTWFKVYREGEDEEDGNTEEEPAKIQPPTSHLRFYYRYYEITVGLGWLLLLFSLLFFVGELVFFLSTCDLEYIFTLLLIPVLPVCLLLGYIAVRNENILLTVLLLVGFLLLSVFYLFKFFRFVLQNCPQCLLTRAIDMLGGNPLITARNQEYEHLALIGKSTTSTNKTPLYRGHLCNEDTSAVRTPL